MSAGAGNAFRRLDARSPRRGHTVGVLIPSQSVVDASNNRFQQLDSTVAVTMDNYDYFASIRPRQTGILMPGSTNLTARPVLTGNSFYLLDTGIEMSSLLQDSYLDIKGNGFVNCRLGISLRHSGSDYKVLIDSYDYPNPPVTHPTRDPVVNLACNTFRRVDTSNPRSGNTVGVRIPSQPVADRSYLDIVCTSCPPPAYFYPGVLLDDPAQVAKNPGTTYLKNWFDDASVPAGSQYVAFQNDQDFTLRYTTYGDPSSLGANSYAQHDKDLSVSNGSFPIPFDIPISFNKPNSVSGTETCQYQMPVAFPNAGIQFRGVAGAGGAIQINAPSTSVLVQNWPNPTANTTSFAYQLKAGTRAAELLIRRATDGREIQRLTLNPYRTSCDIVVSQWPKGTYFATLFVDGMPGDTRRMVVE